MRVVKKGEDGGGREGEGECQLDEEEFTNQYAF